MSRYINFYFIILAYFKSFFVGRANKKPVLPPQRIIALVLTPNIGDMIFATSVFRAIKEKYASAHLTVIGSKKNAITLAGNTDINTYIVDPKNARELIRVVRGVNADFGFTLAIGSLDVASMFLAGVPSIACFNTVNANNAHTTLYKLMKSICIEVPFYIGKYVSQEYLRILEPINIKSTNTKKYLYIDKVAEKRVNEKYMAEGINLSNERIVAISPGAGTKIKQWPEERFAEIADYLRDKEGFKIAVIGGPGDKKEIEHFRDALKNKEFIDASTLPLEDMVYFISKCKMLIANDSGPVYMAEAFGVPTLVVVGPTDEIEHPPHGPLNFVVTPKRDSAPVMRGHIVGYDLKEAREQIEEVTVELVLESLKKLLQNMKSSGK
jgi:ADP-heptose:LPS heptosyltransferase